MKWTKNLVITLAAQFPGPSAFKRAYPSAYKALRRYGLVAVVYPLEQRERHTEFTQGGLLALMAECSSRSDFQRKYPSGYNAARKLDLVKIGYPVSRRYALFKRLPYSEQELILLCQKYGTITEFAQKDSGAYQVACRRGLLAKYGPKPTQGTSVGEQELLAFLQSIKEDFRAKRFGNDYELDGYSESLRLGVEYNGLYWHSEATGKGVRYHLNKTKYFEALGIRIIHVWEHEWRDRKNQVQGYLRSACGANSIHIGARKCDFIVLESSVAREFLEKTHIQGAPGHTELALGAIYQDTLVGVATFGRHHRQGQEGKVLNRFACLSNTTVVGGLAKFSHMAFDKLGALKSWADYSKSQGSGYVSAGWIREGVTRPDYFYATTNSQVVSKQSRQKNKVGTPKEATEKQHASEEGLYRIWDCGKIVLSYKKAA